VGNFAELLEAAGRGIAFQRMDGAAHTAEQFLVSGVLFEAQTSFVDGLQEFLGALKEERAKLRTPFIGQKAQPFTSRRL
jgi:hypothetical protein